MSGISEYAFFNTHPYCEAGIVMKKGSQENLKPLEPIAGFIFYVFCLGAFSSNIITNPIAATIPAIKNALENSLTALKYAIV